MASSAKFQNHSVSPTTIAADSSFNIQSTNRAFSKNQAPPLSEARNAMEELIQQQQQQLGLSDMNLASRKANEAAVRRFQAASWLQKMVGPLDLSPEPSEEEFRLCLRNGIVLCNLMNRIHPGAVPKIVENPTFSFPPQEGAPLSAYQYFENLRNFLVAVEELNLPSFEASDLDEGALPTGLPVKVVDCILSLKAYHEWQQAGGQGLWKIVGPLKPSCPSKALSKSSPGAPGQITQATSRSNSQGTNTGALDDELGSHHGMPGLNRVCINGQFPHEELENGWSNFDSNAGWVHQVCRKFVEVYLAKRKEVDMYVPCEVLMRMVMMVLHDKQPAEIPVIVEFMLKRVIEESDRRFSGQVKRSLSKGLEDLNISSRDSLDEKKVALQREIQRLRSLDHDRAEQLDLQRDELQELRLAFESMRLECQDAQLGWEEEMENLSSKMQGLVQAAEEYHKVAAENRELYNQVQDLKGNIRVYCRVRPFLRGQNVTQTTVDYIGEKGSITIANPTKQGKEHRKLFNFNKVFGPSASQEEVFLDTQPLIRSVLDGFNVCIFAYGQTGSGKTYTMTGPNNPTPKDWGVNFRALHDLFELAQYRNDLIQYEVGVQIIEIYNEQVRDLLSCLVLNSINTLEIRNSSQQNGLNVPDASMISVQSTEDVLDLMKLGHRNRAVGATALNDRSSRSHSVLTVHIKGKELASGALLRGCLHLVDLAGSERVDKSEATGDRLKEAQHINKSLSALGDVIAALAQKNAHVPYRNSKLTQLLQDSLGGHAKTLMFVHVSPDADSHGETISTLKFAERVALVELGAAQSNKESGDIRELKEQVTFLREALAKKDSEFERIQKESRSKLNNESNHERPKSKASHANGPVHVQSNRRQPLEEVRQVQNSVSHSDYRTSDHPMQPHSPLGNQAAFFGLSPEDSGKRKTSGKPPRDHLLSPPHVTSHRMSRNKLPLDYNAGEVIHPINHTHHNLTVRAGRNGFTANGHGFNDVHDPKRQQNGHAPFSANEAGCHSPFTDSVKNFHVHHRRSHSYTYPESGDGSTEGSPGRQDEYDEYEEDDEGTSDFSEERWHKDADTMSPCSLRGDGSHHASVVQEKGRPEGDRRNGAPTYLQQGGSPHVKKGVESSPSSTSSGGGGGGGREREDVFGGEAGSNNDFGQCIQRIVDIQSNQLIQRSSQSSNTENFCYNLNCRHDMP
ncbi:hypothetical protein GOP47_0020015 [Adiantum capillus-veneris]|uniref:Uncharacterized protein n=1 Tax=Adiantum capillus-veneris TaxID=13818 RepID=A0A9D4Z907_ADICA|nr:hypothetical protein GOP47_0020015 [Adiantum capillus-veneris]